MTAGFERLKAALLDGVDALLFATELNRMGRRKTELEAGMATSAGEVAPALLDPRLTQACRGKVERLFQPFEAQCSCDVTPVSSST